MVLSAGTSGPCHSRCSFRWNRKQITTNRMVGNPAKLHNVVPVIMILWREAGGDGRILLMFQLHKVCNLEHWNHVRQVFRSSRNIS